MIKQNKHMKRIILPAHLSQDPKCSCPLCWYNVFVSENQLLSFNRNIKYDYKYNYSKIKLMINLKMTLLL